MRRHGGIRCRILLNTLQSLGCWHGFVGAGKTWLRLKSTIQTTNKGKYSIFSGWMVACFAFSGNLDPLPDPVYALKKTADVSALIKEDLRFLAPSYAIELKMHLFRRLKKMVRDVPKSNWQFRNACSFLLLLTLWLLDFGNEGSHLLFGQNKIDSAGVVPFQFGNQGFWCQQFVATKTEK